MPQKAIVYDINGEGHRANYVRFLSKQLRAEPLIAGWARSLPTLIAKKTIVFSTFESAPIVITLITLLRSILFRKSRIIILRPVVSNRGFNSLMKKAVHTLLSVIPRCRLIVLMNLAETSYLYNRSRFLADPEYWDVSTRDRHAETDLSRKILKAAGGRKVLICTGAMTPDRGLDYLADIAGDSGWDSLNIMIVIAGEIWQDVKSSSKKIELQGAFVEDRYLSDQELFSLFAIATYSWCCYHPSRDMTSGIYGRSCQFGVWPIIRESSILAEEADVNGYGTLIPWKQPKAAISKLQSMNSEPFESSVDPVEQAQTLNDIVFA